MRIAAPARFTVATSPERNGAVSGPYAAAVRPAATSTGGSSRRRSGESPKTSAAETASASTPPLLCAVSQPDAIAVAAASASARASSGLRRMRRQHDRGPEADQEDRGLRVRIRDRKREPPGVEVVRLVGAEPQDDSHSYREQAGRRRDHCHREQAIQPVAQRQQRDQQDDRVEDASAAPRHARAAVPPTTRSRGPPRLRAPRERPPPRAPAARDAALRPPARPPVATRRRTRREASPGPRCCPSRPTRAPTRPRRAPQPAARARLLRRRIASSTDLSRFSAS